MTARSALVPTEADVDVFVQPASGRAARLLISDMDSTMIDVECIDELAAYVSEDVRARIADITERAMRGKLDFAEALRERVALLKGLPVETVHRCLRERVSISRGAATLVRTMAGRGAKTILVSGGFSSFAEPVAREIGFAAVHANILEIRDGRLTGDVEGDIVDAVRKEQLLQRYCRDGGIPLGETLAIGDGANDIPMIEAAGLGVAYRAKPKMQHAADARLEHGDLTALLYAQGIARRDWVTD